jgi:tRNA(Ile)-lysidine synthase
LTACAQAQANPALAPLTGLHADLPLAVAYSGGADSTALLHAAAQAWPGQVRAIHVHHGLQAAADAFVRHCQTCSAALGVPLQVVRVDGRSAVGQSPEDAARQARYRALATAAGESGSRCVLLAQHADDQVETLLLALSRGAGLPGLSAMPARFERHGVGFMRPLLAVRADALRAWLARAKLPFIEDPTNTDTAFTRNRIRHELLPALEAAFPQYRETFARSARHAAEAQQLLGQLAARDLADMNGVASITRLQQLTRARQGNLLRHWLRTAHGAPSSAAQLAELLDQIQACTTRGHRIRIKVGAGFIERQGERLVYLPSV